MYGKSKSLLYLKRHNNRDRRRVFGNIEKYKTDVSFRFNKIPNSN